MTCRDNYASPDQPRLCAAGAIRPFSWMLAALLLGLFLLGGCHRDRSSMTADASLEAVEPESTAVDFVEVTGEAGVYSVYQNGEESDQYSIVESLGGGVGVIDYDRDGRPDLFFPGGGEIEPQQPLRGLPGSLWKNQGNMQFTPVADLAGVDVAEYYSHGCAVADFNNDGFPDLVVTGYGGLQFFRNQGDGTFVEDSRELGLGRDGLWSSSAAWGDFDGDGNLDLYVVHYVDWSWDNHPVCRAPAPHQREVCSPQDFKGLPDTIYYSNGDGTFRSVGQEVGLQADGKGLGVIALDVDLDSRLDIYVANDTTNNFLLLNQADGSFLEAGVISGTAFDQLGISNGSMGLAVFDYDGDLMPDMFVTNYENETFALYRNEGNGNFRCITERTGITALGTLYVGFGTVAGDFNRNGLEDLVVTNGHVMRYPRSSTLEQVPLYLSNDGRGRLTRKDFPPDNYFARLHRGRGVVAVDLDGNGLLDLVFSHTNSPAAVLANRSRPAGRWVGIELIGTTSNRDAIGTRVVLKTSAGDQLRQVIGGGSYLSQNPYQLYWGLPEGAELQEAIISWPNGSEQKLTELRVDSMNLLVQPGRF